MRSTSSPPSQPATLPNTSAASSSRNTLPVGAVFTELLRIHQTDANARDRLREGDVGDHERGRRARDAEDVGVIRLVRGKHRRGDLDLVPESVREERPERAVDEPAAQDLLFGGTTLALDTTTPLNDVLTRSLKVVLPSGTGAGNRAGVANDGFWGIPVRPRTTYTARLFAKAARPVA